MKKKQAVVTQGQLERAQRRALSILDKWIDVVGFIEKNSGYHSELEGIIEDAVACGMQSALGIHELVESEK